MKKDNLVALLYYIAAILYYASAVTCFSYKNNNNLGSAMFCLGSAMLCLGSEYLVKAKRKDKNSKSMINE